MSELATAPVETPAPEAIHPDQPISVEIGGIELTGVGETEESLRDGLPAEKPAPDAPKQTKGRQRYSDLTNERDQERQKREQVERERDELKTRIEALSKPQPAQVISKPFQPFQPVSVPQAAPKFSFPAFDDAWLAANPGKEWSDWNDLKVEALADWKIAAKEFVSKTDLAATIRQGIEADRAQRAIADSLEVTRQRGRTAYPDFDAIVSTGPGADIPIAHTADQAQARYRAIINAPHSEHLQYAIGSNPDLARRLGQMSDVEFGQALASIAPTAPAASPASTGTVGLTVAPPPMQPVGSGSKTAVLSAADLADRSGEDYDSSGFREQIRRERSRR